MKLGNALRRASVCLLSTALTLQFSSPAFAAPDSNLKSDFFDLFPEDSDAQNPKDNSPKNNSKNADDAGLFPTMPNPPRSNSGSNRQTGGKNNTKTNDFGMDKARLAEPYDCPLFENRPHKELIEAIDKLSTAVKASPDCATDTSAKAVEESTKVLKDSVKALSGVIDADPTTVSPSAIDADMAAALGAITALGDVINNNSFLSSSCGRQAMSAGKALLAFNDMINGFAPFALFAVAANAAIAPALPYVVGATVVTTGISVMGKMANKNTLDMTKTEHREAVLVNACQYVKVAKKVRFMQLAQSGKIEKVSQELEQTITIYKNSLSRPSVELTSLLAYGQKSSQNFSTVESRLKADQKEMAAVHSQLKATSEDPMVCSLARTLIKWSQDGVTFPASAFSNLEAAAAQSDRSLRLQADSLQDLHAISLKNLTPYTQQVPSDEASLKVCAHYGRSWIQGINQALLLTEQNLAANKKSLEAELSQNAEYRQFKMQYVRIQKEQQTIKRVEKAMQDLAKDTAIIDRSELAQKMVLLKNAMFGTRGFSWGASPVMAWINHTKTMQERAISGFVTSYNAIVAGAYDITPSGQTGGVQTSARGVREVKPVQMANDAAKAKNLESLTLSRLPAGSRENERACQLLESAWLDWSASMDHLGAIQFFCSMIDPVLDVKMEPNILKACRGSVDLVGKMKAPSLVTEAHNLLINSGFYSQSNLVSKKLKELRCPTPAISVMND